MQILEEFKINRYDVFTSKNDLNNVLNTFLNKVEGMVIQSIKTS